MTRSTHVQPLDDRRAMRGAVNLAATLDAGPAHRFDIVVLDISSHGVTAWTPAPLLPGRPVALAIAGLGRRAARIVWARDDRLGIAFARPLTLAELLAVV